MLKRESSLWHELQLYHWLHNPSICGDFNNGPTPAHNSTDRSHMQLQEKPAWQDFVDELNALDLSSHTRSDVQVLHLIIML